jgi:hypothetical protein
MMPVLRAAPIHPITFFLPPPGPPTCLPCVVGRAGRRGRTKTEALGERIASNFNRASGKIRLIDGLPAGVRGFAVANIAVCGSYFFFAFLCFCYFPRSSYDKRFV